MYLNEISVGGGAVEALVLSIEERTTSSGKPYLLVTVSDKNSTEVLKYWNTSMESSGLELYKIYNFTLKYSMFNEKKDLSIVSKELVSGADVLQYVKHAPVETTTLFNNILAITGTIEDEGLRTLVSTIYSGFKEKLLYWAAAKNHHHNYVGGLLWHTYRIVKSADLMQQVYTAVDRDVVLAACALHDVGKLEEFFTNEVGAVEYTEKGTLFGHLLLGYEIVKKIANKLSANGVVFEQNKLTNVLHCLVSHHGKPEWDAIKAPATLEAEFVFMRDYEDSQLTVLEEGIQNMESGAFGYVGGSLMHKF